METKAILVTVAEVMGRQRGIWWLVAVRAGPGGSWACPVVTNGNQSKQRMPLWRRVSLSAFVLMENSL